MPHRDVAPCAGFTKEGNKKSRHSKIVAAHWINGDKPFSFIAGGLLSELTSISNVCTHRAMIEVGFIVFLFYPNLLMGEYERSGIGRRRGLFWAIEDVFTAANFEIAIVAALIGYGLFEFFGRDFRETCP